jgi:DNA-binding response OmpR family regulator
MYPKKSKILICDDSTISRQIVRKILTDEGYSTFDEADNAKGVIDYLFENNTIHYDLLLLDISMPGMLGTDLVKLIRKSKSKFKDMSIIMISAEAEKQTVLAALVNGANDYILKPVSSESLLKKMRAVWGKMSEDKKSNIILRANS